MSPSYVSDPGLPRATPSDAFWQFPPHDLASRQSPDLPIDVSIAIIGSGITGASVAYNLLKASPNLKIVIVEARAITSGATGRNGGHCKDVPFKHYRAWKSLFGVEAAQQLVKFRGSHLDVTRYLAQQVGESGLADAQFRDVEALTAVFDASEFARLKENMEDWLQDFPEERNYCSSVDGVDAEKKYGIIGASGVLISRAAALWPYRLVNGLLARMLRDYSNFLIEAFTPVSKITEVDDAKPFRLSTPRGTIQAQHVIHCTNGYVSHLIPVLRGAVVPVRGQMTALQPPDTFPRLGHMRSWSLCYPNGGFDYMTQAAGQSGEVFLGGGVEQAASKGVVDLDNSDDTSVNTPALKHLCDVLPKYFIGGDGTKLKQAWTGIMGFTPDGFPVVGKIPKELSRATTPGNTSGHEWVAAGFNGYGMVQSWLSGKAIADMILNVSDAKIDTYFPRKQFECSIERLERMNYSGLHETFHRNVPRYLKSSI